jgi:ABC-type lipoprotein export system ATPase subunit/ABC-type antimicrobial peptide transport system permease subunit
MLKLVNVSKYYSSHNVIALGLRKINLELHSNEFVAIVGESGSGKTTLLNVICGIDTYEEGEMYLNGEETSYFSTSELEEYRKKYIAFVFQNYNLIDSYTVLQNVEAPLILSGYPKKEIRARAIEIIKRVGLEKHIHHKATKLSGGQKQRVVIARALAKDCPIIAADEPTGNLDTDSAKQIIELLKEISKDKLVILVTHDYEQVKDYASRKIRIFDGEIVEDIEVRPTDKVNLPSLPEQSRKMRWTELMIIAFRNLLSVPKKSILMVVIFTIFVFFVAMAYGSFQASLRDFENLGNYYFTNTSINRIVVKKADNSELTQADLDELMGFTNVKTIVTNDYVLDRTFWMENNTVGDYGAWISMQPLPQSLMSEDTELLFGRMPTSSTEVVIAINSANAGEYESYLDVLFKANEYDLVPQVLLDGVTIVGIVDAAKIHTTIRYQADAFFLFSEEVINDLALSSYFNFIKTSDMFIDYGESQVHMQDYLQSYAISILNTLPNNTILLPYYSFPCDPDICDATGSIEIEDIYQSYTVDNLVFDAQELDNSWEYKMALQMNQATYDRFFTNKNFQVTIFTETDVAVDTLVARLRAVNSGITSKYSVIYPYRSQSSDPFSALITLMSVLGASITLIFTLVASLLITYIIFKAIINTKMRDYAIFRTIGANQQTIKKMIYYENYQAAFVGYVIVLIAMITLNATLPALQPILKYYTIPSYFVLLLMALFMAFSVSSRYVRKVFKESVNRTLKAE